MFTKTLKSKLIAVGAGTFAASLGKAIDFALDYTDIGGKIAIWIDKNDKKRNNGWIDI